MVKQAKPVDNGELLQSLIVKCDVDDAVVKKWLAAAEVDFIDDLNDEQTAACIDWINRDSAA